MDETGIDTYLYREYGYARRGRKVHAALGGRKYKRVGIVAAQLGGKIISPLEYSGTTDSALFEFWFEKQLFPALPPGTVVVMDMKKPLIGIVPLVDYGKESVWMLPGYMEGVTQAGGVPVMLPLTDAAVTLEAVFMPGRRFVWAVRRHPEFCYKVDENSRKLFSAFVKASQQQPKLLL